MRKEIVGLVAGIGLAMTACAAESVVLVENGVAKCRVVIREDATATEKLAKSEIEKYFAVATGCGALEGAYPIVLKIGGEGTTSARQQGEAESFTIEAGEKSLTITGGDDAGLLYGAYEVLKRYAGMRWITPGDDGEYCVLGNGGTICVPFGKETQQPRLKVRRTNDDHDLNLIRWHARNGMQNDLSTDRMITSKDLPTYEAFCTRGSYGGGHCLGALLTMRTDEKDRQKQLDKTYAEHPEWFPLVDGKRLKVADAGSPNPCISNPALLDHMAENLIRLVSRPHGADKFMIIGNNDTTVWCQCEKCKALDPKETQGTRGELSDRYWFMINELAKRVWKTRPDIPLGGWAYQNFWYAPVRVRPDPRLFVCISFNNQCWRHSCMDPKCPSNKQMVKIYSGWKKLGMPLVYNRDEIGAWDGHGSPGCEFEPSETVLLKNFREYAELGCGGSSFCVNTPFPEFTEWARKWAPFHGKRYHWYAMWQTCYAGAKAMWNPDKDYTADLEEANRLYYGAAWEPAMKEFRALLTDCFLNTPGCIGWGIHASIGRCLDKPGSEERLKALLEKAVAVARASGDARTIKHVTREKEIFELTWLKARKQYVESYREMTAYKRTGEITVDGALDEQDWQNADTYENFQLASWLRAKYKTFQKTYLKVVYDRDHLYFGVTAMENAMDRIKAGKQVNRFAEGCANLGNHLELWYSYPDMDQAAWHMMINSEGQIIDAKMKSVTDRDLSIVTKAKWAVKKYPDRWTLEMAIPCSEIGQNIMDGMTWKINCARCRELEGEKDGESSTAANGVFHGTANFVNVKFVPTRKGDGARDISAWKNANLNDTLVNTNRHPNARWKKWKSEKAVKDWSASGEGETKEHPNKPGDYYVSFTSGEFTQWYRPFAAGNNRLTFRARGKGSVSMVLYNYVADPSPMARGSIQLREYKPSQPRFQLTPEWKTYTAERKSLGRETEHISVRFICDKDSKVELDDIYMAPCE